MDSYIKEQRGDVRILSSILPIAERGDLDSVMGVLEKRGVDNSLVETVKGFWQSAVRDYVREYTGGSVVASGVHSGNDILDKESFGKNYWGKYLHMEIERKQALIVEKECFSLSMVYG